MVIVERIIGYMTIVGAVIGARAFDLYPWGNYDFNDYNEKVLDNLREYEHLNVWESTLLGDMKPLLVDSATGIIPTVKNDDGNTFQLNMKEIAQTDPAIDISFQKKNTLSYLSGMMREKCAVLIDGYWSYEWCHRKEVRQFHLEQRGKQMKRAPDWSLGRHVRTEVIWEGEKGKSRIKKLIEYFDKGQLCPEVARKRSTEVHITCCEGPDAPPIQNKITAAAYYANANNGVQLPPSTLAKIEEPGLCRYKATACSALLCDNPFDYSGASGSKQPTPLGSSSSSSSSDKNAGKKGSAAVRGKTADPPKGRLTQLLHTVNGTCISKQEDWWTYELCVGSGVRQLRYDLEQAILPDGKSVHKQKIVNQYSLGMAPRSTTYQNETALLAQVRGGRTAVAASSDHRGIAIDTDVSPDANSAAASAVSATELGIIERAGMTTPSFRLRGKDPSYLTLSFQQGTPCDLVVTEDEVRQLGESEAWTVEHEGGNRGSGGGGGGPDGVVFRNRSTEVQLYCGLKDSIVSILEDSTCHYVLKAELSILCSISEFVPYKENTTRVEFLPFATLSDSGVEELEAPQQQQQQQQRLEEEEVEEVVAAPAGDGETSEHKEPAHERSTTAHAATANEEKIEDEVGDNIDESTVPTEGMDETALAEEKEKQQQLAAEQTRLRELNAKENAKESDKTRKTGELVEEVEDQQQQPVAGGISATEQAPAGADAAGVVVMEEAITVDGSADGINRHHHREEQSEQQQQPAELEQEAEVQAVEAEIAVGALVEMAVETSLESAIDSDLEPILDDDGESSTSMPAATTATTTSDEDISHGGSDGGISGGDGAEPDHQYRHHPHRQTSGEDDDYLMTIEALEEEEMETMGEIQGMFGDLLDIFPDLAVDILPFLGELEDRHRAEIRTYIEYLQKLEAFQNAQDHSSSAPELEGVAPIEPKRARKLSRERVIQIIQQEFLLVSSQEERNGRERGDK